LRSDTPSAVIPLRSTRALQAHQALSPPAARPAITWRWANINTTSTGRTDNVVAAICTFHRGPPYGSVKCVRATGTVSMFASFRNTSGSRNWFQLYQAEITTTEANDGRTSGRKTCSIVRNRDAPSMVAASPNSSGTVRNACRMMNVAIGVVVKTDVKTIKGHSVFSQPSVDANLNSGMIVASGGKKMPESRTMKSRDEATGRTLARAYPAGTDSKRVRTQTDAITTSEFPNWRA